MAEIDRDGLWGATGARSLPSLVAWKTGVSPRNAEVMVAVAHRIEEFPRCAEAMRAGRLSLDQVGVVAEHAADGSDEHYASYNINADDAACAIAEAVHAEKLAFLSDIEGVYRDKDDPSSLISELHIQDARKLIEDGYVGGGMIPKLNNCIEAIEHGVNRVHILDGRIPHSLLLEIFTNKGIGTAILREDGEKYYHEHE